MCTLKKVVSLVLLAERRSDDSSTQKNPEHKSKRASSIKVTFINRLNCTQVEKTTFLSIGFLFHTLFFVGEVRFWYFSLSLFLYQLDIGGRMVEHSLCRQGSSFWSLSILCWLCSGQKNMRTILYLPFVLRSAFFSYIIEHKQTQSLSVLLRYEEISEWKWKKIIWTIQV